MARLMSKANKLLLLLSDYQWHTTNEFPNVCGYRYSARIDDLRQRGHIIESQPIKPGLWQYRLVRVVK